MTIRKRFLVIAVSVCVLLSLTLCCGFTTAPTLASAETVAYAATETDEIGGEETPDPETTETATFLGRVWEWIQSNSVKIATVLGDVILLALLIYDTVKSKKKLLAISNSTTLTQNSQADTINVVNKMIEGYNLVEKKLEEFENNDSERRKLFAAMAIQTKAILEILAAVYPNSKNLPQGVKDLVNLKYANALKIVGDENLLIEAAEAEPDATEKATEE